MTGRVVALLVSNGLMLVLGAGLLPLMRLARTRRELVARLPLAYAVGLAATGVLVAELAVVDVPLGRIGLPLTAIAVFCVGLTRLERLPAEPRAAMLGRVPALAVLAVSGVFLVAAARLFAVTPLIENDGWAIWGGRARALFEFGHPTGPAFTSSLYPALEYPLWLPGVEALDFRFLGHFDATLPAGQLFGLALALVGGSWVLLRRHAPPLLLAVSLLAILTAPTFFNQLPTNFADIPLAIWMALGLGALAAWLRSGESGLLPATVVFLGAATLTKNEGEMFVLAAFVAAALVAQRPQRRPLGYAAVIVLVIDLPWRIWVAFHHVKPANHSLSNLLSPSYLHEHSSRVRPTVHELLLQMRSTNSWSYLTLFILVGLLAASRFASSDSCSSRSRGSRCRSRDLSRSTGSPSTRSPTTSSTPPTERSSRS